MDLGHTKENLLSTQYCGMTFSPLLLILVENHKHCYWQEHQGSYVAGLGSSLGKKKIWYCTVYSIFSNNGGTVSFNHKFYSFSLTEKKVFIKKLIKSKNSHTKLRISNISQLMWKIWPVHCSPHSQHHSLGSWTRGARSWKICNNQ